MRSTAVMQEVAKLQAQHNADVQALALSHDEVSEMRFVAAQLQNQVSASWSNLIASCLRPPPQRLT